MGLLFQEVATVSNKRVSRSSGLAVKDPQGFKLGFRSWIASSIVHLQIKTGYTSANCYVSVWLQQCMGMAALYSDKESEVLF